MDDDNAKLISATLITHTNDDNKDKDTGIYTYVRTQDGSMMLAQCANADSSNDDSTEYNDGSDHAVPLEILAWGATKQECRQFHVRIWQKTHGHDTWKFNAMVVLTFANGETLLASCDNIVLKNNGAAVEFDAP